MKFRFKSEDIFVLAGRGIVFRGYVLDGVLKTGQTVSFQTNEGSLSAEVTLIECNRKIIPETRKNVEIGILLNSFSQSYANEVIAMNPTKEAMEQLPSPVELLNTKYPVYLHEVEGKPWWRFW
ncbi:hypothetical protein [Pseudoalteromonas piscicida]|uniref:hypothetical protein n=1 Tax=Pseudoalteromonas piscicida TaxID=43662 RepID=UPI003C7ED027